MALIASKATKRRKPPFLPDDILERLKCIVCMDYLSTPPIMKHIKNGSICGECANNISNHSYIRNTEYEAIAAFVEFPCKNNGCHQRILFGKYAEHEYDCSFRKYECPVMHLNDVLCPWQGCAQELGSHFAEKHRNFYINYNCFIPEIRKSCEQFRLHCLENNTFLVQTKCIVLQCALWCLIRYIGKPKLSGLFKYKLEFIGNKTINTYFTEESLIQTDISFLMDTNSALKINITHLLKKLCCPSELKCKIHIRQISV